MAIIGHGGEPLFLPDSAFISQANGKNDIARSFVGRTRQNYENATGTNPFPQEPPASVKNPDNALGHNHSGPPFGQAFLHPVCSWSNQKANSSKLVQPTKQVFEDVIFDGQRPLTFGPLYFWNRRYSALPGAFGRPPYSCLVLYLVAHKKSANATLDVRIARIDPATGNSVGKNDSVSITSTSPTGYVLDSGGDIANGDPPVAFFPATGGRNILSLEFSSTASSANALTVDAWALCQVMKLRWNA